MAGLRRRGKRVLEEFKAFAHSTRKYDRGRPLAAHANAEMLLYAVNLSGVEAVRCAQEIDPAYACALAEARAAGVEVLAYGAVVTPQELRLQQALRVL